VLVVGSWCAVVGVLAAAFQAISFYQDAAHMLKGRQTHPMVWDRVNLELAGS
jgi:hypothetical protein